VMGNRAACSLSCSSCGGKDANSQGGDGEPLSLNQWLESESAQLASAVRSSGSRTQTPLVTPRTDVPVERWISADKKYADTCDQEANVLGRCEMPMAAVMAEAQPTEAAVNDQDDAVKVGKTKTRDLDSDEAWQEEGQEQKRKEEERMRIDAAELKRQEDLQRLKEEGQRLELAAIAEQIRSSRERRAAVEEELQAESSLQAVPTATINACKAVPTATTNAENITAEHLAASGSDLHPLKCMGLQLSNSLQTSVDSDEMCSAFGGDLSEADCIPISRGGPQQSSPPSSGELTRPTLVIAPRGDPTKPPEVPGKRDMHKPPEIPGLSLEGLRPCT